MEIDFLLFDAIFSYEKMQGKFNFFFTNFTVNGFKFSKRFSGIFIKRTLIFHRVENLPLNIIKKQQPRYINEQILRD